MTASQGMPPSTALGVGPVTLTIPPVPSMARVARLTASSVASLADFSVDEIDDIKIAVSEVVTLLIQQGDGGLVTLEFGAGAGPFTIDGSTTSTVQVLAEEDVALTAAVLDAVSDEHELTSTGERIVVRVSKSSTSTTSEG
jgi:serine/threonine-protein kinase RsbW